jgi:methylated-DNA-[protein]-cysteine S-methyltransferase
MPYLSISTPVGPVTVFEEDDAIAVVEFGRAPDGEETPLLAMARSQLDAFFEGRLHAFSLPLRPRGSSFELRTWAALRRIPYGETRTYGDIARELASTARAIGGACARNPIPIVIPCHRVVGAGGRLTGYSGGEGIETKLALLRLEGASML